jgi:putative ABC transport system permease protein
MFSLKVARVGWRYFFRHPWQTFLLVLGITLGVAVVVAIDLANASASRAFDLSTEAIAGKTTHHILADPAGLETELYTRLRRAGFTRQMTPVISEPVIALSLGERPFTLLGVDPFTDTPFRDYLGSQNGVNRPDSATGQSALPLDLLTTFLTRPGAILLSRDVAELYGLTPCADLITSPPRPACMVELEIFGEIRQTYLVGLLEPEDNFSRQALEGLILADIATAQEITGLSGHFTRIDLILPEDPVKSDEMLQTIQSLLPEYARIEPAGARSGALQEMTSAFRVNLTALSLLALLVGLFLIYNTMTFSVIQRRELIGTLRCLGVTRREIFGMVMSEVFLVALTGSFLGILAGILLGQGALRLVTQTINDLYFVVNVRGVQIPPMSLLKGLLVGIGATLFAAAPPAWEAGSVAPRSALFRSGVEEKARNAIRLAAIGGLVLMALGVGLLLLIPTTDLAVSFAGTFAVTVGFAMLTPLMTWHSARLFTVSLGKTIGLIGRLAPREIEKSISRTSIAIAALMVSVSVTIGVSVMISSFRHTVETWLSQTLQGDIYISSPGISNALPGGALDESIIHAIQTLPEVQDIAGLRVVTVDSPQGPVNLTAIDRPIRDADLFLSAVGSPAEVWEQMLSGGIIVSEPFANRLDLPSRGATVELFTQKGLIKFPVVGVFSDYSSTQGTLRLAMPVYQDWFGDTEISGMALFLKPGADADLLTRQIQDNLLTGQRVIVRSNLGLRNEALAIFERTFAITGAMQILATVVAFIGILSTLLSLQLEKRRQYGILSAVGLTIRQLWGLVLLETGLMGLIAGLLALPAGYALSLILVYIINLRSFGWTLQLLVAPQTFLVALGISVLAALLAGIYPASRMGRIATSEALRIE